MQDSNARTIRGISIAVIILSALALIAFVLGAIAIGAFGAFASNSSLYVSGIAIDGYNHGYYDSLSAEEAAGLIGGSMFLVACLLVWGALCSAVSLVAGILGIRVPSNPKKTSSVFGWSIAGAVASVLSGRLISAVLLVIAAVYANKLRNPEAVGYQPQQPYTQQPWSQQQGYYQQPWGQQQGYGHYVPTYPQPTNATSANAAVQTMPMPTNTEAGATSTESLANPQEPSANASTAPDARTASEAPAAPQAPTAPATSTISETPIAREMTEPPSETEDSTAPESDTTQNR
ncbi:hypothetical protein B5F40_15315 [Gordonibacter sp. An230]|uniref:hypothetical protein n=1 Tax=Gordonibacter sp. An230 TaxID=1965592 RepID=UPI000B376183|nr:hypothetical protein [Gordonibacter sp. An230]OUO86157.1 hypothetical protein B5F40_15315 [Gordonibacter sp. An230]